MNSRKSSNIIDDNAVKMIIGIENIEVFLEENDEWKFHDSETSVIHWNNKTERLDVSVYPTLRGGMAYERNSQEPILYMHFIEIRDFSISVR